MAKYRKLAHVIYQSTYHIVFVPKYQYRILTEVIKEVFGKDIKSICE